MTKTILLICASFFGYAKEIRSALERQGHTVHWFEDRPSTHPAAKAIVRIAPGLSRNWADAYVAAELAKIDGSVDEVLVIKGEAVSLKSISLMRGRWPSARFTLYFWDGYRNMPPDSRHKVDLFDRAMSFDVRDVAEDKRLGYRPLFFLPEYETVGSAATDIDVLFVGTAHTDRYAVLQRLKAALPAGTNMVSALYVPTKGIYMARRIFDPAYWRARTDEFLFKPLGKAQVVDMIGRARVIVDIERPVQSGFTMRTIEMLGARKKLITTNENIKSADFFRPSNHLYIDRRKPIVPASFLPSPWEPLPEALIARYSLSGWIDEVLG